LRKEGERDKLFWGPVYAKDAIGRKRKGGDDYVQPKFEKKKWRKVGCPKIQKQAAV